MLNDHHRLKYLSVEVDESLGTVDVVEGCETGHRTVDGHGVGTKLTPARQHEPVGVGSRNEDAFVSGDVVEVSQLITMARESIGFFGSMEKNVYFIENVLITREK